MLSMRKVAALTVLAVVVGAGVALAQLEPGGTFYDDDGNIHEGNIEAIAAAEITLGCNPPVNDLYCPSQPVSRGQMAAFLVRALDLPPTEEDPFTDDEQVVFEADINALAAAGVTRGCNPPDNDRFCPQEVVTRGQMAAFLVRAFGYTDDGGGDLFTDDDFSVFQADIDRLATAGVTRGCNPPDNDRFCPTAPVLRDQMASFLARALGLDPIVPPPRPTTTQPPELKIFPDGIHRVGEDIDPGTYRSSDPQGTCVAARLSGFSGRPDDRIASESSDDVLIVTIAIDDAGFESSGCGTWSNNLSPRSPSPETGVGDGVWQVGSEVAPGRWQNSDSSQTCYWARLSGYSWEQGDIITSGLSTSIQTVEVLPGDVGFQSDDCGTWTYLGP